MKKQLVIVALLFSLFSAMLGHAQITKPSKQKENNYIDIKTAAKEITKEKVEKLEKQRKEYIENQKALLTLEIQKINASVENNETAAEKGEEEKQKLAEEYASRMNAYNEMIDAQVAYEQVSIVNLTNEYNIKTDPNGITLSLDNSGDRFKKYVRTSFSLPITIGGTFLKGNGPDDLGLDFNPSSLQSIGLAVNHILDKNNRFRLIYGMQIQTIQTQLDNNRIFVPNGPTTQIGNLGRSVRRAQFVQTQLIMPIHIEIGGSKKIEYQDGRVRFDSSRSLKAGVGGFIGTNLSSKLNIKETIDGRRVKTSIRDAFDNNVLVYGLDGYVGYGGYAIYANVNLNDIFRSGSVNAQYFSFGIRFQ